MIDREQSSCEGAESFALRVVGQSMTPEFDDGDIVIIEPDGLVEDGSFVLAEHAGEWIFRQLCRDGDAWRLHALNPAWPDLALPGLDAVRGVVIQKAVPGKRRATRHYIGTKNACPTTSTA